MGHVDVAEVERLELALMEAEDDATQMRYATALAEWGDAGGYDIEVTWDVVCTAALGVPYERAKYRELATLSGGEQKRLVLEYLLDGPEEVLLLDEPDNYLDVLGKQWLERRIRESGKTILFISHDRELLANTATRVVTGGTDPEPSHLPVGELEVKPVTHAGRARLGARVRPGWFVQTHAHLLAVTHDRWFARGFDRFLVFGSDGTVYESSEPVWDERRVDRVR